MTFPKFQLPAFVTNKQTSESNCYLYCLVKLIPENCVVNLRMDHMYKLFGVDKITHFHRVQTLKKIYFQKSAEVGNNNLSCT